MFQKHQRLARKIVRSLNKALRGRREGAVSVHSLLSYGAVDIDPKHLVVWVLLAGAPASELPAWFVPADDELSSDPQQRVIDPDLVVWMRQLRNEIRSAFSGRGWPVAPVDVVFDSAERVYEAGWDYFRG